MIKFFRKIRQNLLSEGKTGKYFKYAIGEIILVVIGILIALQVNNWNEGKKLKKTQNTYLKQLANDVDSMNFQYKGIVRFNEMNLTIARNAFTALKTCEISTEQKNDFDQLLLTFSQMGVLFQIRDTYDEMLSANLLASLDDKQFKSLIAEFFAQRDAMEIYINGYKEELNFAYNEIKKHLIFDYDSNNQPTVYYNISEICNRSEFANAFVEVIRNRENLYQMTVILSQKLELMHNMLNLESQQKLDE